MNGGGKETRGWFGGAGVAGPLPNGWLCLSPGDGSGERPLQGGPAPGVAGDGASQGRGPGPMGLLELLSGQAPATPGTGT